MTSQSSNIHSSTPPSEPAGRAFVTTRWSLVLRAAVASDSVSAHDADEYISKGRQPSINLETRKALLSYR